MLFNYHSQRLYLLLHQHHELNHVTNARWCLLTQRSGGSRDCVVCGLFELVSILVSLHG